MKPSEVFEKVGAAVHKRVRVTQHDANRDAVSIGVSKFGNEIQINLSMVQADVKVATGDIVPHPYAGFSGGGKAVMPGLAGRETVMKNHLMVKTELNIGEIKNNPVREFSRMKTLSGEILGYLASGGELVDGHVQV